MTAKRIARGEAGSITIASSGASSYGFLPRLVTLATAEMHDVDLVLLEMVTTAQVEALAANNLISGSCACRSIAEALALFVSSANRSWLLCQKTTLWPTESSPRSEILIAKILLCTHQVMAVIFMIS